MATAATGADPQGSLLGADPGDGRSLLAAARRLGPLPWSALDPPAPPPLPACAPAALAAGLDAWWEQASRPDPLPVVVAGADPAALARRVLAARPACLPATRWLLVAPGQGRPDLGVAVPVEDAASVLGPAVTGEDPDAAPAPAPRTGPVAAALPDLPAGLPVAVVLVAGLLGALPADRYIRSSGGWAEVRLAADGDRLVEVLVDAGDGPPPGLRGDRQAAAGTDEVGDPVGARRWLAAARRVAAAGVVVAAGATSPPAGLPPRSGSGATWQAGGRLCPQLQVAAWTMRGGAP